MLVDVEVATGASTVLADCTITSEVTDPHGKGLAPMVAGLADSKTTS